MLGPSKVPDSGLAGRQTGTPDHARHLGAAYPFATEPGRNAGGVLVGRDLIGGAFRCDPFRLYLARLLTKTNIR